MIYHSVHVSLVTVLDRRELMLDQVPSELSAAGAKRGVRISSMRTVPSQRSTRPSRLQAGLGLVYSKCDLSFDTLIIVCNWGESGLIAGCD